MAKNINVDEGCCNIRLKKTRKNSKNAENMLQISFGFEQKNSKKGISRRMQQCNKVKIIAEAIKKNCKFK